MEHCPECGYSPNGNFDMADCPECGGTGFAAGNDDHDDADTCENCNGSGLVYAEDF